MTGLHEDDVRPTARSKQAATRRIAEIIAILHRLYPDADCELRFGSPLELIVATILSAQCTDERVNAVTRSLFRKYRSAAHYMNAPDGELEEEIRSTGFFNNKARSLRGMGKRLVEAFGGEVPRTMDDLLTVPGVARKTANVVLGTAFQIAAGVVVDTHVTRLSHRLGLSRQRTPEKIEPDLIRLVPKDDWIFFGHALIWHGRRVCRAKSPDCPSCGLKELCPSAGVAVTNGSTTTTRGGATKPAPKKSRAG